MFGNYPKEEKKGGESRHGRGKVIAYEKRGQQLMSTIANVTE